MNDHQTSRRDALHQDDIVQVASGQRGGTFFVRPRTPVTTTQPSVGDAQVRCWRVRLTELLPAALQQRLS